MDAWIFIYGYIRDLQDLEGKVLSLSLLPVTCLFVYGSRTILLSPSAPCFRCPRFSSDSLVVAPGDKRSWQREREQHTCKMLTRCNAMVGEGKLMQAFKREQGTMQGFCLSKQAEGGKMDVNEKIVAADTRLTMSWDELRRFILKPSWIKPAQSSNRKMNAFWRKPTGLVCNMCRNSVMMIMLITFSLSCTVAMQLPSMYNMYKHPGFCSVHLF